MYTISKDADSLLIEKEGKPLVTPMMRPVRTAFSALAERLVEDLAVYGEEPSNPVSLVAFQYAMTDFFSVMPRNELERSIAMGFERENDWTFNCPTVAPEPLMNWVKLFGTHAANAGRGRKWLTTLTLIQLCAVYVLGRALRSVNIPYILTTTSNSRDVQSFVKDVQACYPFIKLEDMTRYFANYLFFFTLENPDTELERQSSGVHAARLDVRIFH